MSDKKRKSKDSDKPKKVSKEEKSPKKASNEEKSTKKVSNMEKSAGNAVTGPTIFEELKATMSGENSSSYKPVMKFSDTPFSSTLLSATKDFSAPTAIQSLAWPVAIAKRDLVAIAETGSGKTFGFALPGIHNLMLDKEGEMKRPRILVLSPTRELALQTEAAFSAALKPFNLHALCVYGGVSKDDQKRKLKKTQPIVIIATPGRCIDLIDDGALKLSKVDFLVLDEADRMLDLGFEPDVRKIIKETKKERQTLMFSATWPNSVQTLAKEFLNNPVQITVGSTELKACKSVEQHVMVLAPEEKEKRLLELLRKHHSTGKNRIIVFALYKKEADRIEIFLRKNGFRAASIHGDKQQSHRTETIEKFRRGEEPLLIATDVAARGLDIKDVEFVINFTFPLTIEDYVHRIGRTGRGGKSGISYTFFTLHDKSHSGELVNVLKSANQAVPDELLKFGTTVKKKEHKEYGAFYKPIDPNVKASHVKFDNDD